MSLLESTHSLDEIKEILLSELEKAAKDRESAFRFVILSTISEKSPNARYVVLRRFEKDIHQLFMYTDKRSDKVEEIKRNPLGSILAYDKQRKCQIKLKGKISIHHRDEIAKKYWHSLDGGLESYNTKKQPGKKVDSLMEAIQLKNAFDDEYFAVLIFKVSQAEILQLKDDGHIRALFDFEKGESSFLVP